MMLSELPSEIIVHIAEFLPSTSAITHLAGSCRRLYKIIKANESAIFRAFVQSKFAPTPIPPATPASTPAFWKDAACALVSRSRALNRLGIIGRFVVPPENITRIGFQGTTRVDNPTLGYRPAIDSHEIWNGDRWADRKEVLVWGAGHQVVLRTKQSGTQPHENWVLFNDVEHATSYDDICGMHLIHPDSGSQEDNTNHLILGRVRGDLAHLALSEDTATHKYEKRFMTYGLGLDQTDLQGKILAAHFDNGSIALYQTATTEKDVEAFAWVHAETDTLARSRYSKLLSSSRIAVATGKAKGSLAISNISPDGIAFERDMGISDLDLHDQVGTPVHANATAIAPLNNHQLAGSPGDVFLAAWGDRTIRLHDLRSPTSYETTYRDTTDINLIYSVHPFGQDRFLAGAGGDAVVKIFDLRMRNSYDYLDAQTPTSPKKSPKPIKKPKAIRPHKDFSLFLSAQSPSFAARHPQRARRAGRYRGPIYTMSTPSPSSPTVYTGVVDGIVRLDFASTDDLTGPSKEWYDCNLDLGVDRGEPSVQVDTDQVLRLAGYERPDPDDLTTTSKLRNQHGFWYPESRYMHNEAVTGWDRRWDPLEKPGAWRRRDS